MAKTTSKTKSKSIFVCQSCGAQSPKWQGRCNDCGEWNSLQEETVLKQDNRRGWTIADEPGAATGDAKKLSLSGLLFLEKINNTHQHSRSRYSQE